MDSLLAHVERILQLLPQVKAHGQGWRALCPAHNDHDPSLHLALGTNDSVLLKCRAGCSQDAIIAALGIHKRDLFPARDTPVTLAALAHAKQLPVKYLRESLGWHDLPDGGVGIPYRDTTGKTVHVKKRVALIAKEGSYWPKGQALMPYGLEALALARSRGYLIIPEGETDAATGRYHGFPVLSLPGTDSAKCLKAGALEDIPTVYLWQETDKAGANFIKNLLAHLPRLPYPGIIKIIRPQGLKDLSDLHVNDPALFETALQALMDGAEAPPVGDAHLAPEREAQDAAEPRRFPTLASISYTARELQQMHIPDLVEVIPEILPEGLAMIAGGAAGGKSVFCLQVALDTGVGGKFLGRWPTTQGDVLFLATEDSERRIRDRLRSMWQDEGLWPESLTVTHRPQTLDNGLIDQLNEWLDVHPNVRLIVIDLFADVRPPRKASGDWYADDRAAAKLLSHLGNSRHLCVLASHHTNRLKSDDPFESFHGGNGLLGAAETKMILQPQQEGQAIWRMKGRDVAQQAYLLRLEEGLWEYVGEASTANMSQSRRAILAYFEANPGLHSPETVARALGKSTSTTTNLMIKLCAQRLLVKGDYGLYRLFQKDTL